MRMFHVILIGLAMGVVLGAVLFGCTPRQPPGGDLYIGLEHYEKERQKK